MPSTQEKKNNRITSHWFTVQFDWNSLESKSLHCCSKDARGVALIPVESPCHESKDGHKPTCWRTWINIYIYTCWDGSLSVIMDYGNQVNQDRFEILSNEMQSVNESIHENGIVFITEALSKSWVMFALILPGILQFYSCSTTKRSLPEHVVWHDGAWISSMVHVRAQCGKQTP